MLAGTFALDGELPVNPDGGLKSFGHPVGASGLRMMFEGWLQLRGEATAERQLRTDRSLALTHNLGGDPGEMVSFVSVWAPSPADQRRPEKRSSSGTGVPVRSQARTNISSPNKEAKTSRPRFKKKMFSDWLAWAARLSNLRSVTAVQSMVVVMSSSGVPKLGVLVDRLGELHPHGPYRLGEAGDGRARNGRVVHVPGIPVASARPG